MTPIAEIFRFFATLDGEGRHIYGTDRESNHRYGAAYEEIFARWGYTVSGVQYGPWRENVNTMLEVGVADGASLMAWHFVFPNARIVGMDLHRIAWNYDDHSHIEWHIGDARLQHDCEAVVAGRTFDLIVDDASHQPADVLVTLLWLWGSVVPGGLYVIEDLTDQLPGKFADLFRGAEIVDTVGPFGGHEPLIVLRKPV